MGKNPNEDEDDSSDERLDDDEEVTSEESDEEINEVGRDGSRQLKLTPLTFASKLGSITHATSKW